MTKNNEQIQLNCLLIEALVKTMVIEGTTDTKKLVTAVDQLYPPASEWEMEVYSEAIIYAKLGVLN
jgi:hypothetical protein